MIRCELRCYNCNKTIGYMSVIADESSGVIRSTQHRQSGEIFPICCPVCEAIRLKENKDNMNFHLCKNCTCFSPKIDDNYLGECVLFGPRTIDSKACKYWEANENDTGCN